MSPDIFRKKHYNNKCPYYQMLPRIIKVTHLMIVILINIVNSKYLYPENPKWIHTRSNKIKRNPENPQTERKPAE